MSSYNLEFLSNNLQYLLNKEINFNDITFKIYKTGISQLNVSEKITVTNECITLFFFLFGSAKIISSKQSIFVQKGLSFFVTANMEFSFSAKENCKYFYISFSAKKQSESNEDNDLCNFFKISKLFSFSTNMNILSNSLTPLETKLAFLQTISDAYVTIATKEDEDNENNLSAQIISYLNNHYSNPVQIMNLADFFSMSYRNISRTFKSQTGITITNKLNEIRINKAKEFLVTNMPINEIAKAVGYSNEYYFSVIFKKYTGLTPSKFRNYERN